MWKGVAAMSLLLASSPQVAASGEATPVRTVPGAQEFLRQVLPGSGYASTPMSEMLAKARREQLRGRFDPLPVVFEALPLAECVSRLSADVSATWFVVTNPQDSGDASVAALEDLFGESVIGNPDGMHFGSIRALRLSGSEVRMRFAGNTDDAVLYLDSAETAARVHVALAFLQERCDGSRATGF